jgi:prevent-host-death family protein
VGIQGHLDTQFGWSPQRLQQDIERYASLGLKVAITEADVRTPTDQPQVPLTSDQHPAQAQDTMSAAMTGLLALTGSHSQLASQPCLTIIQVMTTMIPLADAKARLSAVLDGVRDTHDRVVITRNGRPEAVIISVSDLETIEETLDLLSTPGAIDEIRTAEAEIARGEAIGADELTRLMAERVRNERDAG